MSIPLSLQPPRNIRLWQGTCRKPGTAACPAPRLPGWRAKCWLASAGAVQAWGSTTQHLARGHARGPVGRSLCSSTCQAVSAFPLLKFRVFVLMQLIISTLPLQPDVSCFAHSLLLALPFVSGLSPGSGQRQTSVLPLLAVTEAGRAHRLSARWGTDFLLSLISSFFQLSLPSVPCPFLPLLSWGRMAGSATASVAVGDGEAAAERPRRAHTVPPRGLQQGAAEMPAPPGTCQLLGSTGQGGFRIHLHLAA